MFDTSFPSSHSHNYFSDENLYWHKLAFRRSGSHAPVSHSNDQPRVVARASECSQAGHAAGLRSGLRDSNPDLDLLPGTNLNVISRMAENALKIPKEALRHERGETGVFVLAGDRIVCKKVTTGVGNTTRTQVEGLNDGDAVALPSDKPLRDGMPVRAIFP